MEISFDRHTVLDGALNLCDVILQIADAAFVADAAVGVAAGVVVTLPLDRVAAGRADSSAAPASSHSLPPDQVLAIAAELRGSMPRGVFVGIGGAEFGFGAGLSPAVAAGLARFASTLTHEIRRLAAPKT